MTFVPYHSPKGTVDLVLADQEHRAVLDRHMEKMRRITVRWVPALQLIQKARPEMHWCSYDDGRVVAFVDLDHDESFSDLEPLYEVLGSEVRRLQSLGSYTGKFIADPEPEDDIDINWRKWAFRAGDSQFVLNVSFSFSRFCRVVSDGTETKTVERKRVVCDPGVPGHSPAFAPAAVPAFEVPF